MQYALRVSQDRLRPALYWLFENNTFYKKLHRHGKLRISEENLKQFDRGVGAVPQPLVEHAVRERMAPDRLAEDTTSALRPDGSDGVFKDSKQPPLHEDPLGTHWAHNGLLDGEGMGLDPAVLEKLLDKKLKPELRVRGTKASVLIVPAGSTTRLFNRKDPDVDHGAFPTLYPYGVGGPAFARRYRLGVERYTRRLMHLADRRFATHAPFCFMMFASIQRQRVCGGSKRTLEAGKFVDFTKDIDKLSPAAIEAVIDDLQVRERHGHRASLRHVSEENKDTARSLARLFNRMDTLGGSSHLPRTPAAKKHARREINAMYVKLGLPDLFVTVNPEDRHSPLVVYYQGKHRVKLGLDDPDMPAVPSALDRFRIVVNDPLAAAQFSARVMQAFIDTLLGFSVQKPAPSRPLGVFGDVQAYHFNDEEQNRGSLHYHGLLWLKHKPDTASFEKLIYEPEFQQRLLDYLSAIIKNELPCQWDASELKLEVGDVLSMPKDMQLRTEPCYVADCGGKSHEGLVGDGAKMTFDTRASDDHPCLKRIGDPHALNFVCETFNHLLCIGPQCVFHLECHTKCCFKDSHNQRLQKWKRKCRFGFPCPLCDKAHFDSEGNIVLRRRHHWCGSYNPWLLAALCCNHDIKTMWGHGTKHMAVIMYITNYVTKLQLRLLSQLPLVGSSVTWFREQRSKLLAATPEHRSRALLLSVHLHLQRDIELSMQSVVHTLAGYQERYVSHKPVTLCTASFLSGLEQYDAERGIFECEYDTPGDGVDGDSKKKSENFMLAHHTVVQDGESKQDIKQTFAWNQRLDYQLRPDGVDNCCVYDFFTCWSKRKRRTCSAALAQLADNDGDDAGEVDTLAVDDEAPELEEIDAEALFEFREGHPQRQQWGMQFRRDHASVIATIFGPMVHNRVRSASRFARNMLLLFKPFRDFGDLRADGQTWKEAFAEFELTAPPRIQRYINNFESLDNHKRAWETDMQQRELELQRERRSAFVPEEEPDDARFSDGDNSDHDNDSDDDTEQDPDPGKRQPEINYMKFTSHDHNADQLRLYQGVMDNGLFSATVADAVLITDNEGDHHKHPAPAALHPIAKTHRGSAQQRAATGLKSISTKCILQSFLSKPFTASLAVQKTK